MGDNLKKLERLRIFAGTSHVALAEDIAKLLNEKVSVAEVTRFSNGEIQVVLGDNVRGKDVFLIQTICAPVNDMLMELLIMVDALKRSSVRNVTAVIPYYAYNRQDQKLGKRDPIIAKVIANLISSAGVDRIATMDLHTGQLEGFFDIPVEHTTALPLLAQDILVNLHAYINDLIVVSPDMGGVNRVRHIAQYLNCPIAILDKRRPKPDVAVVVDIVGDVKGKTAILLDDTIDTAGSIVEGARVLKEAGAREVYAYCTHAVFSGNAVEQLEESDIKEVVVTDTIPFVQKDKASKIRVITVAQVFSEAILKIFNEESLKKLFI